MNCETPDDPSLVDRVIRFNNTQNPIKAWELRVIDPIQRKLTIDFEKLGITYQTRRGLSRRRSTDVLYQRLGPFLAAFYGDPGAAYRNKTELFENESRYRRLFDDDTHVKNLLFVYRLGNAVQLAKSRLKAKVSEGTASTDEQAIFDYYRYGAFPLVLIHLCAEVLGLWLEGKDSRYKRRVSLSDDLLLDADKSEDLLSRLVDAVIIPAHQYLKSDDRDAYQITRTQAGVDALTEHVKTMINAVEQMQPSNYESIKKELRIISG